MIFSVFLKLSKIILNLKPQRPYTRALIANMTHQEIEAFQTSELRRAFSGTVDPEEPDLED